jgi:hypothetical protein
VAFVGDHAEHNRAAKRRHEGNRDRDDDAGAGWPPARQLVGRLPEGSVVYFL